MTTQTSRIDEVPFEGSATPKEESLERSTNKKLKKRLVSGGIWAIAGRFSEVLVVLIVNALLSRLLPPSDMGAYFLTFNLVSVAALIAQLGFKESAVQAIAGAMGKDQPAEARSMARLIVLLLFVASFLTAGAIYFGVGRWFAEQIFHAPAMAQVISFAAAWTIAFTLHNALSEVLRGFHDIRMATLTGGVIKNVVNALIFAFCWWQWGQVTLSTILMITVFSFAVSDLIALLFIERQVRRLPSGGKASLNDLLIMAWPFLVNALTLFALGRFNLWILGAHRPQEEVAVFGATLNLATLVLMPLVIVNQIMPSSITELYVQGRHKELQTTLRTVSTVAGVPSLLALIAICFLAGPMLGLIYGEHYQQGANALILLSLGTIVNVWTGPCGITLKMTGHQTTTMTISLVAGAVGFVTALLVVDSYGATGVAAATALGTILQNLLSLFFAKWKTGIWTHVQWNLLHPQSLRMLLNKTR